MRKKYLRPRMRQLRIDTVNTMLESSAGGDMTLSGSSATSQTGTGGTGYIGFAKGNSFWHFDD